MNIVTKFRTLRTSWRWHRLVRLVRCWANTEMDQWEKWTFVDVYGNTVYVTLSYVDDYPDEFENIDGPPDAPPA